MTAAELAKILADHKLWLNDAGGRRADLGGACLSGADLRMKRLAEEEAARESTVMP